MEGNEGWLRGGISGGETRGTMVRGVVKEAVLGWPDQKG